MFYSIFENGSSLEGVVAMGGLAVTDFITLYSDPQDPEEAVTKRYVDLMYARMSNSITMSGIFNVARFPEFTGAVRSNAGSGQLILQDTGVVPGVGTKFSVRTDGRIYGISNLASSDIPVLSWGKFEAGAPTTIAGYGITDLAKRVDGTVEGELLLAQEPENDADAVTKNYIDSVQVAGEPARPGDLLIGNFATDPVGYVRATGGMTYKLLYPDLYEIIGDAYNPPTNTVLDTGHGHPYLFQSEINRDQNEMFGEYLGTVSAIDSYVQSNYVVTKNYLHFVGGVKNLTGMISTVKFPLVDGVPGAPEPGSTMNNFSIGGATFLARGYIHVLGGNDGTDQSNCGKAYQFTNINPDGTLGYFDRALDLPARIGEVKAFVINGQVYVFYSTIDDVYDPGYIIGTFSPSGMISDWMLMGSLENFTPYCMYVFNNEIYYFYNNPDVPNLTTHYKLPISFDGYLLTPVIQGSYASMVMGTPAVSYSTVYIPFATDESGNDFGRATLYHSGNGNTFVFERYAPHDMFAPEYVITDNKIISIARTNDADNITKMTVHGFKGGYDDYSVFYEREVTTEPTIPSNMFTLPRLSPDAKTGLEVFIKY